MLLDMDRVRRTLGAAFALIAMIAFAGTWNPAVAQSQPALLLFDGEKGVEFAGCLNCSSTSDAAVCNRYGKFGSRYEEASIWNRYGKFGSRYETNSPWNKYGAGLRVVDSDGRYYGRFTLSSAEQSRLPLIQALLSLFNSGIDLSDIRDKLCD